MPPKIPPGGLKFFPRQDGTHPKEWRLATSRRPTTTTRKYKYQGGGHVHGTVGIMRRPSYVYPQETRRRHDCCQVMETYREGGYPANE